MCEKRKLISDQRRGMCSLFVRPRGASLNGWPTARPRERRKNFTLAARWLSITELQRSLLPVPDNEPPDGVSWDNWSSLVHAGRDILENFPHCFGSPNYTWKSCPRPRFDPVACKVNDKVGLDNKPCARRNLSRRISRLWKLRWRAMVSKVALW